MSQKRKPNPYQQNMERVQAREQAAARLAPKKPTGQQLLARAFAARAQEMIEKGLAAPSVIAGNAIALSRGREPLEFDRLSGGAIALDENERKALARVIGGYRMPGGWAGALQKEFDLAWSPKKAAQAPAAGAASRGAKPALAGAGRPARPASQGAKGAAGNGAKPSAEARPRPNAISAPKKPIAPPTVIIKRSKRVEGSGPQGEGA